MTSRQYSGCSTRVGSPSLASLVLATLPRLSPPWQSTRSTRSRRMLSDWVPVSARTSQVSLAPPSPSPPRHARPLSALHPHASSPFNPSKLTSLLCALAEHSRDLGLIDSFASGSGGGAGKYLESGAVLTTQGIDQTRKMLASKRESERMEGLKRVVAVSPRPRHRLLSPGLFAPPISLQPSSRACRPPSRDCPR